MLAFFRQGPIISLYAIIISILASPFFNTGFLQLWMIVPCIVLVFNWKYLLIGVRKNILLTFFFIYTLLTFFLYAVADSSMLADTFFKQLLFTSAFLCLFLILSYEEYFLRHFDKLVKFLNTVVVVTCLYGIYQSIGRLYDLPFTGNEFLDFRAGSIAGLIQISSFFKEPALFSQFLLSAFFIHAFVLDFKYKWVIALIIINVVLTISVTGYISVLALFSLWLAMSASHFLGGGKIKMKSVYMAVLMVFGIFVFMQSELFEYIFDRFSSVFAFVNTQADGSGEARTNREVEYIWATIYSPNALTGFGVNYSRSLPDRYLALNAIAEIIIRWGIIGVIIFIAGLLRQILITNKQNRLLLLVFMIIYVSLDGAIAKPAFWIYIGLVLLFNQIKPNILKTTL